MPSPEAEIRRAAFVLEAKEMGIDEAFIDRLVETFYQRIRTDARLGSIFNREITDWGPHLSKMKLFWSSVALMSGAYSGKPVPAHTKLEHVTEDDFTRWLELFAQTLDDIAPSPAVKIYFLERAERIAKSLQLAMFGIPSLPLRP